MKKYLLLLLTFGLTAALISGCGSIPPDDHATAKTPETIPEEAIAESPETSDTENEISNTENNDSAASYYGTWEVKDYQWLVNESRTEETLALSLDEMESFRGKTITYQSDSIMSDGEKVADGNFTYKTENTTYDYDGLIETFDANLGEWWTNINEVTFVTIDSDESFFGNQFFEADSETIWIYYEGVFFLAKSVD